MSLLFSGSLEENGVSFAYGVSKNEDGDKQNMQSEQLSELDIKKTTSIKEIMENSQQLLESKIIESLNPMLQLKMLTSQSQKKKPEVRIGIQEQFDVPCKTRQKLIKSQTCGPQGKITWSKEEILYLENYFKYGCQKLQNRRHNPSFEDIKWMEKAMNLTSWMAFCKDMDIMGIFGRTAKAIKFLSYIFKKNENEGRRLNFLGFCSALSMVLVQSCRCIGKVKFEGEREDRGKRLLGLESKSNHLQKLKKMNVNISQCGKKPVAIKRFQDNKVNKQTPVKKTQDSVEKKRKIYLSRQDRIQSRVLSRLNLNNINQLHLKSDPLPKYCEDDTFLIQYLERKRRVPLGAVNRLDRRTVEYLKKITPNKQLKQQKNSVSLF